MNYLRTLTRRIVTGILAFIMAFTLMPVSVNAISLNETMTVNPDTIRATITDGSRVIVYKRTDPQTMEDIWQEFVTYHIADSNDQTSLVLKLYENWSTSDVLVADSTYYNLMVDLNGKAIVRTEFSTEDEEVILVDKGCSLSVFDSSNRKEGAIAGGRDSGVKIEDGLFELRDGRITGNDSTAGGGGVTLNSLSSVFNMYSGSVCDNTAENSNGGGILIHNGVATISGGTISGNHADNGGGIYIDTNQGGDALIFTSGKISNNTANNGGGIAAINGASTISGEITGNRASNGGGIYSEDKHSGSTKIDGASIIGNNASSNGGGIFVLRDCNLSLIGATVTGNSAYKGGGGYVDDYSQVTLGPNKVIVVQDNTASYAGGNLYLCSTAPLISPYEVAAGSVIHVDAQSPNRFVVARNTTSTVAPGIAIGQLVADNTGYVLAYSPSYDDDPRIHMVQGTVEETAVPETFNGQTLQKGTFMYASASGSSADRAATYYYSDGYFMKGTGADSNGDANDYNEHLATLSICMAMASFGANSSGSSYETKSKNVEEMFTDIGMKDFYANEDFQKEPETDTMGVAMAHKTLSDGSTLVAVGLRGAGYGAEWASNVTLGATGEHKGFSDSATIVMNEIIGYLANEDLQDAVENHTIKFWIAGFSRAGAVANLTAKRLNDRYDIDGKRVFAYCLEAPQGGVYGTTGYMNIKNMINPNDIVPLVAPTSMAGVNLFARYGEQHDLFTGNVGDADYESLKAEMMKQLGAVNSSITFSDQIESATMAYFSGGVLSGIFGKIASWTEDYNNLYGVDALNTLSKIMRGTSLISKDQTSAYSSVANYNKVLVDAIQYTMTNLFYKGDGSGTSGREFYANTNPVFTDSQYSSLQTALREIIALVQTAPSDVMAKYMSAAATAFMNLPISSLNNLSLDDLYQDVIGGLLSTGWLNLEMGTDPLISTCKPWIIYKIRMLIADNTSGPGSLISKDACDKLNQYLPPLLWRLFYFVAWDYDTTENRLLATLATNADTILQAHYPEVDFSWMRASDSYYQNHDGIVPATEKELEAPVSNIDEGEYSKALSNVKLTASPADAEIYYYVSNSYQQPDSWCWQQAKKYTGAFELPQNMSTDMNYRVFAYAKKDGQVKKRIFKYSIYQTQKVLIYTHIDIPGNNGTILYRADSCAEGQLSSIEATNPTSAASVKFNHWKLTKDDGTDVTDTLLEINPVTGRDEKLDQATSFRVPNYNVHATAVYESLITEIDLKYGSPDAEQNLHAEWMVKMGDQYYTSAGYCNSGDYTDACNAYGNNVNKDWLKPMFVSWNQKDVNKTTATAAFNVIQYLKDEDAALAIASFTFDKNNLKISVNGKTSEQDSNVSQRIYSNLVKVSRDFTFMPTATGIAKSTINVTTSTTIDQLKQMLPSTVMVQTKTGDIEYNVTNWDTLSFEAGTAGSYVMTGTLGTNTKGIEVDLSGLDDKKVYADVNEEAVTVARPTADLPELPSGTAYKTDQKVSLFAETGATIYYTIDGNTPTVDNDHLYDAAKKIDLNTENAYTIKAIAVKDGTSSETATFRYTINYPQTITVNYVDKRKTYDKLDSDPISKDLDIDPDTDGVQSSLTYNVEDITEDGLTTLVAPFIENEDFRSWTINETEGIELSNTSDSAITFKIPGTVTKNISIQANYVPIVTKVEFRNVDPNPSIGSTFPSGYLGYPLFANIVCKLTYADGSSVDLPVASTIEKNITGDFAWGFWLNTDEKVQYASEYELLVLINTEVDKPENQTLYSINSDTTVLIHDTALPEESIIFDGLQYPCVIDYIYKTQKPKITNISAISAITNIDNGTLPGDLPLSEKAQIKAEDGKYYYADVAWDLNSLDYDPTQTGKQTFTVKGNLTLPDEVDDDPSISKEVSVDVTVNAKKVASPISSYASGHYRQSLNLELASATKGASIYYTLDGSDPEPNEINTFSLEEEQTVTNGTLYSAAIPLAEEDGKVNDYVIKAIAVKEGCPASDITTYNITLDAHASAADPAASYASGRYEGTIFLELTSDTPNADIYYTLDGSDPDAQSTRYEGIIQLNAVKGETWKYTVKAVAVKDGYEPSNIVTYTYELYVASGADDDGYVVVDTGCRSVHPAVTG